MTTGFFLGKFMPPHKGHQFVAEVGCNMVSDMTVLVCSTDDESMDGALRHQLMQESVPRARVKHLHENLPQQPEDDPDFWNIWQAVCRVLHPNSIDYVFGSEPYIFKLASVLSATPVLVDPDREIFSICASDIRAHPDRHRNMLATPMPSRQPKRVCLLGPESSGKSVLGKKLAATNETSLMPEYGRTYWKHYKQATGTQRRWESVELTMLAKTHIAMSQALCGHTTNILIEDTDPIQTAIWETQLLGAQSSQMMALVADYKPADLYLILSPDVPFTQDGGRYFTDMKIRRTFFEQAIEMLSARKVPMAIIDQRDWSAREEAAQRAIKSYLAS